MGSSCRFKSKELFGVKQRTDNDFYREFMPEIPYSEQGCFEKALNGTLFLDEIGDIPLSYQEVLLRVLQERSVTNLGSSTPVDIKSVRIIAATNKDIVKEVEEDRFREDLFFTDFPCVS